ncbi:GNAT family N-acetyltransferase [Sulfitobacter sp. F26169L]|uniref:GNAT family N-acetyltransferase n=1 Tax=Sulfitobacter sp. F26169L TaxID=2996015 RepID=UPI002260FD76|nr:GNAT family N-acetyltransferase [Sulfitobacter sp. F26169L]MCX7567197.1 GNAT family N-acetyltransferase [Sulfitobacter sp. F26169L]
MTPQQMAQIHSAAFSSERGWREDEFAQLLAQPYTQVFSTDGGFAVTRTVAAESELLTLAVEPDQQRRGIARRLMGRWLEQITTEADTAFLEVAADNYPALFLYESLQFERSGLRPAYYTRKDGTKADAVVMMRLLTRG